MNLYLLTQDETDNYDTYDMCVVAAETEAAAVRIHPHREGITYEVDETGRFFKEMFIGVKYYTDEWATNISGVTAKLIGKAVEGTEAGVICASFNQG